MKIRVLGGAREVGGSCVAVETQQSRIALDYGIKLDKVTDEYPKNFDAIFVSHAHLDHSGSLVRLSKSRNQQRIVGSKVTRDITLDLLGDMVKIQNSRSDEPVYDDSSVSKVRDSWLTGDSFSLPDMNVEFYGAGHVAGAKMIGLHTESKTILYTGDFCIHDTEILEGCSIDALPKSPDVLICESTYGGKTRSPRKELINQFLKQVSTSMKERGNILIPTFAFHRSQEMAKRIDQAIETGKLPKYNAYTISNLAQKITGHFNANKHIFTEQIQRQNQPFEYKHIQNLERTSDIIEPAIVICTAGFGQAGASFNLLTQWADGDENTVILTSGYLPPDSPLRLAQEKRYFRANGEKIDVHAKFHTTELSGHADQRELVQFVGKLKPKRTLLVHGDLDQAEALSNEISDLTEVEIPEKNENIHA